MEKHLIPQLRFPEFKEIWESMLLDNYAIRGSGHTPSKSYKEYYDGDINWISLADSKRLDKGYISRTNKKITKLGIKNSSAVLHPAGTVLMSRDAGVGKSAVMKHSMAVSQHFIVWKTIKKVSSNWFLYYWLQIMKPRFEKMAVGSTIKTIGLPYFKKLEITKPCYEEQQKIASFLKDVDDKISKLTKKKDLLEKYKKGIMQKIFSQELRFKDDNGNEFPKWEVKKLGKISNITTGSSNRQDSGLDGEYTFFDRSEDIRTSSRYLFDGEAIIVAGEGSDFIPKYFVGKFDLHQRTYAIMNFKDSVSKYLYYCIHFHRKYFLSQAVGSTVKSLRLPMFQKMPIKLPVIEEQVKIASFLSDIDAKIEALSTKIENSKAFKKGLLQQMFV